MGRAEANPNYDVTLVSLVEYCREGSTYFQRTTVSEYRGEDEIRKTNGKIRIVDVEQSVSSRESFINNYFTYFKDYSYFSSNIFFLV